MSYFPKRGFRVPLGTAVEYGITLAPPPPPPPPIKRAFRSQLGSLSDDSLSEEQWRDAMLSEQRQVREWQERWVKKDEMQRWLQMAATLSIPLAAAVWKWILGRRAAKEAGVT